MKKLGLHLCAVLLLCGIRLFAADNQLDDHFILVLNAALTTPRLALETKPDFYQLKTNAEAFHLLEKMSINNPKISSIAKFTVVSSTLVAAIRCAKATDTSLKLNDFLISSNFPMSLSLIDDATKLLDQTPVPMTFMNVDAPGVPAAGMDPANVKDPVVRAEYERRIAENRQKIKEIRLRVHIERDIDSLRDVMKSIGYRNQDEPTSQPRRY